MLQVVNSPRIRYSVGRTKKRGHVVGALYYSGYDRRSSNGFYEEVVKNHLKNKRINLIRLRRINEPGQPAYQNTTRMEDQHNTVPILYIFSDCPALEKDDLVATTRDLKSIGGHLRIDTLSRALRDYAHSMSGRAG